MSPQDGKTDAQLEEKGDLGSKAQRSAVSVTNNPVLDTWKSLQEEILTVVATKLKLRGERVS